MTVRNDDSFNLNRFTIAQEDVYDTALSELRSGLKQSHWMWFIFPQINGLGTSDTSIFYAIKSLEEAKHFLQHSVLGKRLVECTETVLALDNRSARDIFGYIDETKFKSSMTLFACVLAPGSLFDLALEKYFHGERDQRTLQLLKN